LVVFEVINLWRAKGKAVEQITRGGGCGEAVRVGVDLAKRVIQVHAVDGGEQVPTSRALRRDQFLAWCVRLPEGCMVAMQASSSAHHWARKPIAFGLDARILSAQLVSPYRQEGATGKNDANDAAAICEAASRPRMRFFPVKSIEQQSMLCVHRLREGLKADRAACINRIRGLLLDFGLAFAQGPRELQLVLSEVLEDAGNGLGTLARLTLQRAQAQWRESAVMTAHRRPDRISAWAAALKDRSGWQKAVVALANKNARILWAVMTRGEAFDANHSSVKPVSA
jgi:hypothetical protein